MTSRAATGFDHHLPSAPADRFSPASPIVISVMLVVAIAFGGSAQFARLGDIPVRLAGVALLAWLAWRGGLTGGWPWTAKALVAAILLVPAVQLVPLPPAIWTILPGRADYPGILELMGGQVGWAPISLQPWRTFDALLSLLPLAALFAAGHRAGPADRRAAILAVLAMALAGMVVGAMQQVGGPSSALRFYQITNADSPTGWFANRNHHAMFLACAVVLSFQWMAAPPDPRQGRLRLGAGAAFLLLLLASVLLTESRAGIGFAALGAVASALIYFGRSRIAGAAILAVSVVVGLGAYLLVATRLGARFGRLAEGDARFEVYPWLVQMIGDHAPVGSGIGTFAALFRRYETETYLNPSWWNHAHNDYAQVLIEAGLPGLAAMLLFLIWWARLLLHPLRGPGHRVPLRPAGPLLTAMLLLHSAADYPLRTAALGGLFAFFVGIMMRDEQAHLVAPA